MDASSSRTPPDPCPETAPKRRFGEPRPGHGEAPVQSGEVFFSRTDARGVILSGNEVFRRVTDYAWDDLIGASHALTRHPDMPRGLYWLMWQMLSHGEPIGIYLKNRTQDGLWYWVFAILTQVEGGFLSVQFKPTSPMLARIRQEYADLMALEGEQALAPEASGAAFLDRLADMGYSRYDGFMAKALAGEIAARSAALGLPAVPTLERFAALSEEVAQVEAITRTIKESFAEIRNVPVNLRILATRLEAAGGPISVISSNYATLSDDIQSWLKRFLKEESSAFGRMRRVLDQGLFLQAAAEIQREALVQFCGERRRGPAGGEGTRAEDVALLEAQADVFRRRAREGLDRVATEAGGLSRAAAEMKRLIAALSNTRMLCKIEAARRAEPSDALEDIIGQLDGFQRQVDGQLARFTEIGRRIQTGARDLST